MATAITRIHSTVTNTPAPMVQVVFIEADGYYVGGRAADGDELFVYGSIRAGRTAADRQRIIEDLLEALPVVADIPRSALWVYLLELPVRHMAEHGRILPEPGGEEEWMSSLDRSA